MSSNSQMGTEKWTSGSTGRAVAKHLDSGAKVAAKLQATWARRHSPRRAVLDRAFIHPTADLRLIHGILRSGYPCPSDIEHPVRSFLLNSTANSAWVGWLAQAKIASYSKVRHTAIREGYDPRSLRQHTEPEVPTCKVWRKPKEL